MPKNGRLLEMTGVLRTEPIDWPKKGSLHALLKKLSGEDAERGSELEIVYEDAQVVAFHEIDDDPNHARKWDVRVTVAPKHHKSTLLDLGVADEALSAALLNGLQQAALRLNLHETGFEVFAGVLPPYQQNGYLTLRLRSGKRTADPEAKA
jgi:hypothetical protein